MGQKRLFTEHEMNNRASWLFVLGLLLFVGYENRSALLDLYSTPAPAPAPAPAAVAAPEPIDRPERRVTKPFYKNRGRFFAYEYEVYLGADSMSGPWFPGIHFKSEEGLISHDTGLLLPDEVDSFTKYSAYVLSECSKLKPEDGELDILLDRKIVNNTVLSGMLDIDPENGVSANISVTGKDDMQSKVLVRESFQQGSRVPERAISMLIEMLESAQAKAE